MVRASFSMMIRAGSWLDGELSAKADSFIFGTCPYRRVGRKLICKDVAAAAQVGGNADR